MIHDKRQFLIGVVLMAGFLGALFVVFRPMFEGGRNLLDYLDGVFNSTSKASAYYIPAARAKAEKLGSAPVAVKIRTKGSAQAAQLTALLRASGASVAAQGATLEVSGDLQRILSEALADADAMFHNDGPRVAGKYGFDERRALYGWHVAMGETMRELDRQAKFREAAAVRDAMTKALEPAYNYYGVTAVAMKDMIWIALAALAGYVLYTVWYGYAILYLFEGWGVKLGH
ncbi:MAG TPA: hypothetical protein VFL83_08680 [Anaeromyxobacter sp.]|nr:hypothetical protein [Anaeromyxobacter sp.]